MPQYGSKYRAFVVNIRPEINVPHPTMPVILNTIPAMAAEFGVHRPEIEVETDAGVERFGDISGFFYDLDADATAKGWSDEEYEIAKARLDSLCDTWPEAIWHIEKQPALVPWPKYPDADAKLIPALANELGLVAETIAYERENQNRQAVLKGLEALLVTAAAEEELTAA